MKPMHGLLPLNSRRRLATVALAVVALCNVGACASSPRQTPDRDTTAAAAQQTAATQTVQGTGGVKPDSVFTMPDITKFTRMQSGLMYYDVNIGTGFTAIDLRLVDVHYTGMFENGTVFDSSIPRGTTIQFTLGKGGQVIRGWDQGIRGMKVGGRRILVIPPELAYGTRGSPPAIPPNATLIFDVTLVAVK